MRRPPPLPDLGTLTEAQKDELIVGLWETLVAIDGAGEASRPAGDAAANQGPRNAAAPPSIGYLRERMRRTAPSHRAQARSDVPTRLGRSFEFLESKVLLILLVAIGFGFLADFGVGWYQRRLLSQREKVALELQNAAFGGLYVELIHVAYEPDGKSYRPR